MKNVRTTHFSVVFAKFFSLWREQFLCSVGDREATQARVAVEKTPKRAGATPLFRLSAAQKVRGVAPALRHDPSCRPFFHGDREFGANTHHPRSSYMSIVKKAPGIITREIKLEEPVNELLEDYARFIESNADHVINAVLKKVLWRDQDYRKWRGERRTAQTGPDKTQQPTDARPRT
jgi:hypothetical protein